MRKTENEAQTYSTDVPRWVLRQQNPGDYTFRVQSVCGIGRVSAWTSWQPYTIPEEEEEESWISDPDLVYSVEPEPEPYIPDPIEDAKSDLARILDAPFEFLIVPAGSDCVGCEDTARGGKSPRFVSSQTETCAGCEDTARGGGLKLVNLKVAEAGKTYAGAIAEKYNSFREVLDGIQSKAKALANKVAYSR